MFVGLAGSAGNKDFYNLVYKNVYGTLPDAAGYQYGYALPDDFRHKIWLKRDAGDDEELPHQILGAAIFANAEPVVMEYVAEDAASIAPASWSAVFTDLIAAQLAVTVASAYVVEMGGRGATIKGSDVRRMLEDNFQRKLSDARNKDAIQQYPVSFPVGSFVRARMGRSRLSR